MTPTPHPTSSVATMLTTVHAIATPDISLPYSRSTYEAKSPIDSDPSPGGYVPEGVCVKYVNAHRLIYAPLPPTVPPTREVSTHVRHGAPPISVHPPPGARISEDYAPSAEERARPPRNHAGAPPLPRPSSLAPRPFELIPRASRYPTLAPNGSGRRWRCGRRRSRRWLGRCRA